MEVALFAACIARETEGDILPNFTFVDNHFLHPLFFSFERNPERFGIGNRFCMGTIHRFKLQLKAFKPAFLAKRLLIHENTGNPYYDNCQGECGNYENQFQRTSNTFQNDLTCLVYSLPTFVC